MFRYSLMSICCMFGVTFSRLNCVNFHHFKDQLSTTDFYLPEDGDAYATASMQWSYPSTKDKIHPSMIIYPKTDDDIFLTINFASECDYKIVVRSGGHQYAALSSCDSNVYNCIQLDMKYYNKITEIYSNKKLSFIEVESGVKLGQFYSSLDELGCFLPAGEHLGVGIGGHVLTGGCGLLTKSFGLLGDYVKSFDIILSNGTKLESVSINSRFGMNIENNKNNENNENKENNGDVNQLYSSVLGGPPGSFGIITKYVFDLHSNYNSRSDDNNNNINCNYMHNDCYPNSMGFKYTFEYSKQLMIKLTQVYMNIHNDKKNYLDNDRISSLMFGVTYNIDIAKYMIKLRWIWPGSCNCDSSKETETGNDDFFDHDDAFFIARLFLNAAKELNVKTVSKEEVKLPMSKLMTEFIENHSKFAVLPYELRAQYTIRNFEQDFIEALTDEVDSFINEYGDFTASGLFVSSMLVSYAQGRVVENDPFNIKTSYPFRDAFVFAPLMIYYNSSSVNANEMKRIVINRMDSMLDAIMNTKAFNYGKEDFRELSLAYGDVNIRNIDVRAQYYPNETIFDRLKDGKLMYDPIDMFHTSFTVPVPQEQVDLDAHQKQKQEL